MRRVKDLDPWRRDMRTLFLFLAGVLLGGCLVLSCSSEKSGTGGYASYDDPDHLLLNLEKAWKNRDLPEYRDRILYAGKTPCRSGILHRPFTLYFSGDGDRGDAEIVYGYEREVNVAGSMFGGRTSEATSRIVTTLDLIVERLDEWESIPTGKEILGDACPDGTKTCRIGGVLRLTLSPPAEGGEEERQSVHHDGRIYVFPVKDPNTGNEAYRLWKWIDFKG